MMNRYYNPPNDVRLVGRKLYPSSFVSLMRQIQDREVLIAYFHNQAPATVATHVGSAARHAELERLWAPIEYYAMPIDKANEGMDHPFPAGYEGRINRMERSELDERIWVWLSLYDQQDPPLAPSEFTRQLRAQLFATGRSGCFAMPLRSLSRMISAGPTSSPNLSAQSNWGKVAM
jgi:hypothetical protein